MVNETHPTLPIEPTVQRIAEHVRSQEQVGGAEVVFPDGPALAAYAEREFRETRIAKSVPARWRAGFPSFRADLDPQSARLKTLAMDWVAAWPPADHLGLVLQGPGGCGKTHLGCAILAELIRHRGVRGVRWNCAQLFQDIRAAWQQPSAWTEADVFDDVCASELVFLDDFGSEGARDFIGERLYLLIDRLYEEQRILMVSTNLDSGRLKRNFGENGERICSRLASMVRPLGWDGERFPRWPVNDFRRDARLTERGTGPPA